MSVKIDGVAVVALLAIAAGGYLYYRLSRVGGVPDAVNPLSDDNVVYRAANEALGLDASGESGDSIGTALYGATHTMEGEFKVPDVISPELWVQSGVDWAGNKVGEIYEWWSR